MEGSDTLGRHGLFSVSGRADPILGQQRRRTVVVATGREDNQTCSIAGSDDHHNSTDCGSCDSPFERQNGNNFRNPPPKGGSVVN